MLRAIEIENFKAFGKRQRIELAAITLIFGENSAGKSSILQALSLLKQSRRHGDENVFLVPRIEGGYVDLGSFEELIFDHDQKKTLKFRLDFRDTAAGLRGSDLGVKQPLSGIAPGRDLEGAKRDFDGVAPADHADDLGVELSFFRRSARSAIQLVDWSLYENIKNQWHKLASFAPLGKSQSLSRVHRSSRSDTDRIRKGECTWVIDRPEFWERVLLAVRESGTSLPLRSDEGEGRKAEQDLLLEMRQLEKRLENLTTQMALTDTSLEEINDQIAELTYLFDQSQELPAAEMQSLVNARGELCRDLAEMESQSRLMDLEEAHIKASMSDVSNSPATNNDMALEEERFIARRTDFQNRQQECRLRLADIEGKLKTYDEIRSSNEIATEQAELLARRETVQHDRNVISVEIEDCVWLIERKEREYSAIRELNSPGQTSETESHDNQTSIAATFGAFEDLTPAAFVAEAIERQRGGILNFRGFAITGRDKEARIRGVPLANYGGDLLDKAIVASNGLETVLRALCPMGPFRSPPERWYVASGQVSNNVGYGGARVPEFLFSNKELVEKTNVWLDRLAIGYHIKPRRIGVRPQDLFELRLIDTRRSSKTEVAIPDVGFGISQILPFIVQSLVTDNQIISIEQPEVHIHPRLQADIGDLLAEASAAPHNNQFIVETHSEHLVLRLQSLVRHGVLAAENVSIIYVSRGEDGAHAERLRLDSDGDFIDEWPGGFFPERSREFR